MRNAVGPGGDTDTLGCIAGGVAEAFFGVPREVENRARSRLTPDILDVLDRFRARFVHGRGPYRP